MKAETEVKNPDTNPESTRREESKSKPGRPRRAGRGRRNSRGGGRRSRGGSSESARESKLGKRDGKSDSESRKGTKQRGSEQSRRRGQQGSNRSRRGRGKQDSHLEKQKKAMSPESSYAEPTAVFIHQYTRIPSSRDYDTGMGQRPKWFVRWEKDFDQGYEH